MKDSFRISELIAKEIKGVISEAESTELNSWINSSEENHQTYRNATDREKQMTKLRQYRSFDKEGAWSNVEEKIFGTKTISLFNRSFMRYAAAILLPLMLLGGAGYWYYDQVYTRQLSRLDVAHEPGTNKAILLLPDGTKTTLGQEVKMLEASQSYLEISDNGKILSYSDESIQEAQYTTPEYHELITPAGGTYELALADGTKVWLNAGSSLRFPASFSDSTRHVFLSGEAYFDVVHDGLPFIVSSGEMDVRVMGTSFNISSYQEDAEIKTTLVEGKVRVDLSNETNKASARQILNPNQQAVIAAHEKAISVREVDASSYASWVKGKLEFNSESLDQVMRKLARWYDFEYRFDNLEAVDYHFTGRLDRTENISGILEMLEMTTDVKFKIYNNQVVVK